MQHVMMLLLSLIVISISGCSCREDCVKIVKVPQKCVIPTVEKPAIDNTSCDGNMTCVYRKVLSNYEKMKLYATDLEAASIVCK